MRLFEFHRGKAILRPMSRIAKTVNVFPTAHRQPAITPHTMRWGTCRASVNVSPVPRTRAGKLQRETKAPSTIMNEITKGDTEVVTSFVGASAPASQRAAAKPQNTPSACSFRWRECSVRLSVMIELKASRLSFAYRTRHRISDPPSRTTKGIQK